MKYIETQYENTNGPHRLYSWWEVRYGWRRQYLEERDKRLEIQPWALLWRTTVVFHLVRNFVKNPLPYYLYRVTSPNGDAMYS